VSEDDFYVRQDRRQMIEDIRAKQERGERLTRSERTSLWAERLQTLDAEITPLLRAGKIRSALDKVIVAFVLHNIQMSSVVDELEDRIAALEAAAKPRQQRKTNITPIR